MRNLLLVIVLLALAAAAVVAVRVWRERRTADDRAAAPGAGPGDVPRPPSAGAPAVEGTPVLDDAFRPVGEVTEEPAPARPGSPGADGPAAEEPDTEQPVAAGAPTPPAGTPATEGDGEGEVTAAGLPRRRRTPPAAQPGGFAKMPPRHSATATERSPEQLREMLSRYQRRSVSARAAGPDADEAGEERAEP